MDERKITDVDQHQPQQDADLAPSPRRGSAQKPPVRFPSGLGGAATPDASEELADLLAREKRRDAWPHWFLFCNRCCALWFLVKGLREVLRLKWRERRGLETDDWAARLYFASARIGWDRRR